MSWRPRIPRATFQGTYDYLRELGARPSYIPFRGPRALRPEVRVSDQKDIVCEHGTAMDVHCCNCHSGFLFDSAACVCSVNEVFYDQPIRQRKVMGEIRLTWECLYRRVTPAAYAHRLEAVLERPDPDDRLPIPLNPYVPPPSSFIGRERIKALLERASRPIMTLPIEHPARLRLSALSPGMLRGRLLMPRLIFNGGEKFTAWLRSMNYMYSSQWILFKPVTPRAYAHRLEAVLDPVPDNEIPYPRDRRVEVRGGAPVAGYFQTELFYLQPKRSFVITGIKEPDE